MNGIFLPNIILIKPIIEKLGPGGIMCNLDVFDMGSPNPDKTDEDISALAILAHEWSRCFHKVETSNIMNCPLVYVTGTGASSGLTYFEAVF